MQPAAKLFWAAMIAAFEICMEMGQCLFFGRATSHHAAMTDPLVLRDVAIHQGFLDRPAQLCLVDALRDCLRAAPLVTPVTPRGQKMSVAMSAR